MSFEVGKMDRRELMAGAAAFFGAAALPTLAKATAAGYVVPEHFRPTPVKITSGYAPGTIHVFTENHLLYFVTAEGQAIRYGVGVGAEGRQFKGNATIRRKVEWPSWTPTANMIRRRPDLYKQHAGGMPGGPGNPLGARAMYLYRNGRDSMYRIHGTTVPQSIGRSVSNGCIRMVNDHVEHLYALVPLGTRVYVS